SEMLATPEWLIAHHHDPNVRVIDPRQPAEYAKGHIPGAVNANTPFKDPDHPLHVMTADQAQAAIRALGISDDTTAIVAGIGMLAGRIWWFLRDHGLADVRILDGGIEGYVAAGGRLVSEPTRVSPGTFTARVDPSVIARADDLARE